MGEPLTPEQIDLWRKWAGESDDLHKWVGADILRLIATLDAARAAAPAGEHGYVACPHGGCPLPGNHEAADNAVTQALAAIAELRVPPASRRLPMTSEPQDQQVTLTVDVRIKDIQRTALLVHELQELIGQMRVAASPFAEPLEHAFDRFVYGGDDDGEKPDDK